MVGARFTVSVAAVVIAGEPMPFVNTASICSHSSPRWPENVQRSGGLAGEIREIVPPSILTCHCTVGVGMPLAAAVKVAEPPAMTVWFVGYVAMESRGRVVDGEGGARRRARAELPARVGRRARRDGEATVPFPVQLPKVTVRVLPFPETVREPVEAFPVIVGVLEYLAVRSS